MLKDGVKEALDRVGLLAAVERASRGVRSMTTESGRLQRRHRADMLRFYGSFMGEGDQVFDVGANVGGRTEIFLALGATVVAVEPQPECLRRLHRHFGADPRVAIVGRALDRAPAERVLRGVPGSATASLSERWIGAVNATGRFAEADFVDERRVVTTTLDALIAVYGLPRFCKIDVEGFELEVVSGLSRPIPALSLELTPETMDLSVASMEWLDRIAPYEFNFSMAEQMQLAMPRWLPRAAFMDELARMIPSEAREQFYGDVYARLRP